MPELEAFSIAAVNLPEHAENSIHTDEGAKAAGFPSALVAGVTTYAYLCQPPIAAWGEQWVGNGAAELRLLHPVYEHALIHVEPTSTPSGWEVAARSGGQTCASARVARRAPSQPERHGGEAIPPLERELSEVHVTYADRAGVPRSPLTDAGIVHPATWVLLANDLFHRRVVEGPWIHTRSLVRHRRLAHRGEGVEVIGTIIRRFETRLGERAVADVTIVNASGEIVAEIEHEALIRLV